jgi:Ca2+-binding RTX toxin-like protein
MRDRIAANLSSAALLLAAVSCSADTAGPTAGEPEADAGAEVDGDPIEAAVAGLGVMVSGCSSSTSAAMLTLNLAPSVPMVINAPNGKLMVNGHACTSLVSGVSAAMTTNTTYKIRINGTSGSDKVILDLLPGTFGAKILSSMGGITVDFASQAGGSDVFMLRGSSSPETFKFATSQAGTENYIEFTGDSVADVKIMPAQGVALMASLGGGADTVIADTNMVRGFAGINNITTGSLQVGLTAYGGAGADKFTGGPGDDVFYGGDDDDLFKMAATADGADVYQGDDGSDTVDYSNRTGALTVDIGTVGPGLFGTADLALDPSLYGVGGTLDGAHLDMDVDAGNGLDVFVVFSAPLGPSDVASQINAACAAAGDACRAWLSSSNMLNVANSRPESSGGFLDVFNMDVDVGLPLFASASSADADDGLLNEHDDVRPTTENILGGSAGDTLVGDASKNTIRGGRGNDQIDGGGVALATCAGFIASQGDALLGEDGDDTFFVPMLGCSATIAGGLGQDAAIFSGRSAGLQLSNDGVANDGEVPLQEKASVGVDVESITGGFGGDLISGANNVDTFSGGPGDDFLIGGAGNDSLVGGAGSDTFNGGLGSDSVSYAGYGASEPVTVTLCSTTAITVGTIDTACGARDDGHQETDQIANVERVVGGAGDDQMTAASMIGATFEGGNGDDTLIGGGGNDVMWGEAGDDILSGGSGDDELTGGAGDDTLDGGSGAADLCVNDAADAMPAKRVMCELGS